MVQKDGCTDQAAICPLRINQLKVVWWGMLRGRGMGDGHTDHASLFEVECYSCIAREEHHCHMQAMVVHRLCSKRLLDHLGGQVVHQPLQRLHQNVVRNNRGNGKPVVRSCINPTSVYTDYVCCQQNKALTMRRDQSPERHATTPKPSTVQQPSHRPLLRGGHLLAAQPHVVAKGGWLLEREEHRAAVEPQFESGPSIEYDTSIAYLQCLDAIYSVNR
jgi:hypothetical protein